MMAVPRDPLRKIRTLLRNPQLIPEYAAWMMQRPYRSSPVRHYQGIKISGFCSFSEYHSFPAMLDAAERAFIDRIAPRIRTCVDVGANIGAWSLYLSSLNERIRIAAFEPDPYTYRSQVYNIALNGNGAIQPFNCAVGREVAQVAFASDPRSRATQSLATSASANTIVVPCTTLDAAVAAGLVPFEIDLLKVDVEGFEELVFEGAKDLFGRKGVRVVYFEHCPALIRRAGLQVSAPLRRLLDAGYGLHEIGEEGRIRRVSPGEPDYVLKNLVAVAPEAAARALVDESA
ncbi:MAG: FkbM family methyltransferase [Alphaproteobacteria bacterium]|nr:FkbM family methyltransferase [Alphaproteobacteria bacterium]